MSEEKKQEPPIRPGFPVFELEQDVTGDHTGDWWEAEIVEDDDDTDE